MLHLPHIWNEYDKHFSKPHKIETNVSNFEDYHINQIWNVYQRSYAQVKWILNFQGYAKIKLLITQNITVSTLQVMSVTD